MMKIMIFKTAFILALAFSSLPAEANQQKPSINKSYMDENRSLAELVKSCYPAKIEKTDGGVCLEYKATVHIPASVIKSQNPGLTKTFPDLIIPEDGISFTFEYDDGHKCRCENYDSANGVVDEKDFFRLEIKGKFYSLFSGEIGDYTILNHFHKPLPKRDEDLINTLKMVRGYILTVCEKNLPNS